MLRRFGRRGLPGLGARLPRFMAGGGGEPPPDDPVSTHRLVIQEGGGVGYVEVPDDDVLQITDEFTFFCRLEITNADQACQFASKMNMTGAEGSVFTFNYAFGWLFLWLGGELNADMTAGGGRPDAGLVAGQIYDFALIFKGNESDVMERVRIYQDKVRLPIEITGFGALEGLPNPPDHIVIGAPQALRLGVEWYNGSPINQEGTCKMHDVQFYTVALTSAEVEAISDGERVTRGRALRLACTEGAGTTVGDHVNGLVGTLHNTVTWEELEGGGGGADPEPTHALVINGAAGGYIEVPDDPAMAISTAFTFFARVKSPNDNVYIASKMNWRTEGDTGSIFWVQTVAGSPADVAAYFGGPLDAPMEAGGRSSGLFPTDGAFHDVAVVYDGSQATATDRLQIYVDGSPLVLTPGSVPMPAELLTVGNQPLRFGATWWDGAPDISPGLYRIYDMQLFNRALSGGEVLNLGNGTTIESGRVARFACTEGSGTTVEDHVNGLVGTFVGDVTWEPLP